MTSQKPYRALKAFAFLFVLLSATDGAYAEFDTTFLRADGQEVPVKIYQDVSDPCPPLMIISHGLGGSSTTLSNLAKAAEDDGYRVIVMEHRESDHERWVSLRQSDNPRETIIAYSDDPEVHRARFLDLDTTWDHATSMCKPPFTVLAGHSMGAQTTMMEAGAVARFGKLGKDRFDAYVALSPQGVGPRFGPDCLAGHQEAGPHGHRNRGPDLRERLQGPPLGLRGSAAR